jgi:hypothetical protein
VKGIQPVALFTCPAVTPDDAPAAAATITAWELRLPSAPGPVTQKLQAAMQRVQRRTDVRRWLGG